MRLRRRCGWDRLQVWLHGDRGRFMDHFRSNMQLQLQPQPENTRYGKAKVHRNLTGTRLQVHTACTATRECLRTLLCCGARLRNS